MSWSRDFVAPVMTPVDTLRPFLRISDGCGPPKRSSKPETVTFKLASFNALSLLDTSISSHAAGLHGATGRVKLLCETLLALDVSLAGFQECRTFKSSMTCMGYRRFASGRDDNACYGVELWVAEKGIFNAQAVTVLHTEPTLLLASLPFRGSRLCVLVAHGPHRVHSEAFRQAWWERVSCICSAHARDAHWIVLADGNCRVGSHVSRSIGSHQADAEDLAGGFFRLLLEDLECWLPATFALSAHGDGGTLYQKRNGEFVRSDYIAVPRGWVFSECAAWVEPAISAGHRCLDHFAVVVACSVCFQDTFRPRARAQRIDSHAVLDPNNFEAIDHILATAPVLPWDMDASEQVAHVVDHVYRGLASAFPQKRQQMRGQQFSEDTQRLHQLVRGLRHSVRTRYGAIRDTLKRCAFLAWRHQQAMMSVYRGRWLWRLRIRHALDCVLLHRHGAQLRSSCKADRAACLSSLAQQIADSPCGELHRAVRKVMRPKKFRRQGSLPLPMLRAQDGTICSSQEEATGVWREHFRVLEAGVEVSPRELAESCRSRQVSFEGTDQVNVRHLPTWAHLHDAFRHASPHKASGPDLIPPALCRVFSQRLTELFWPVMMKTVLRANEAVGLKGGVLHRIAKPNAVNNTTAGFRGILVQSCLSKVLHRAVRHLAVDHWRDHAQPMQIGGRQGCPADFGQFCSRAFLAYAKAHNRSAAILFVDISAAYYGVIREAVLGAQGQSRPVDALASSLGLSQEDLQRLQRYIDDEPVLRLQNAADVFSEVANELHRSTWFVLSGDIQLVETFRGTRPGGSLADIVFNILFSKVLDRRDRSAFRQHVPAVPWSGVRSPWPAPTEAADSCRLTEVSDVIYADDLASFLGCDQAAELPRALSCAAAETVDTLLPHGLSANIGPTKTAAIVAPAGPGSRAVRGDLYGTRKGRIPVIPENRGSFLLDLVPDYKHLGSYISHSGCMLKEIRHRLAAGRSALKEGKQRLFACRQIPLARRVSVFKAHVLSAVLSGVGTWPALNGQEATLFTGGLISMYRQLLCLRVEGGFSCTIVQILDKVGLLPPSALLHLARLRFLGQLVRSGPDPAWALLCHFSAFLQALREASDWLLAAVGTVCSLGDIVTDWTQWVGLLHDSPGRFRGILKRAEAWHLLRISILAQLENFGREHWTAAAAASATPLEECTHACIPCKLAFHTRQQWGAHAHRVHAYHSRAHRIAKGRTCGACGLQVASLGRLRTHLRLSPACVSWTEQAVAAGTFVPDLSVAHELAPAVPGIGKGALGPVEPEVLPDLVAELSCLTTTEDVTDEDVFAVVVRHIAPLPVLRHTLSGWCQCLPVGRLRSAAEDVLLVLHPVHFCTKLSGRQVCSSPADPDFTPLVTVPRLILPVPSLPLMSCGPVPSSWTSALGLAHLDVLSLCLDEVSHWDWRSASAACVSFAPLPAGMPSAFSPPSCSLRDLRQLLAWTCGFLAALGPPLKLAHAGRPVCLRFPFSPGALEPLSGWLLSMTGTELIENVFTPCLTLEFNCFCLQ